MNGRVLEDLEGSSFENTFAVSCQRFGLFWVILRCRVLRLVRREEHLL